MWLQDVYPEVFRCFGGNPYLIFVGFGTIYTVFVYFIVNLPFIILDIFQPKWAWNYRIQGEKEVTMDKYFSAFKRVLPNLFLTNPLVASFFYLFTTSETFSPTNSPSLSIILRDIVCSVVMIEVAFYYSHRFFHHPALYKHVHKVHHEFTAPVSIVSIYCHPIEQALGNLMPVLLGPTLCRSHAVVYGIWILIVFVSTTFSHSGYDLRVPRSPKFHDYHHKVFNECFGVLGWLDRFHGTSRSYLQTTKFKL